MKICINVVALCKLSFFYMLKDIMTFVNSNTQNKVCKTELLIARSSVMFAVLSAKCCFIQVLPDYYVKDWIPGEKVTETDVRDWAEWEIAFFDFEKAVEYREKVKAVPKGKAQPKRMIRAPLIVKVVRASAYQHIKALDNMLETVMGVGLENFQVHATEWSNPLRAVLQERE